MAKRATPKKAPKPKTDSRWITVRSRFDYRWPSGAITHFSDRDLGEHKVKNELADFAVEKGYATEGKLEEQSSGQAADNGSGNAVDHADGADAGRPADRPPLDPDAK